MRGRIAIVYDRASTGRQAHNWSRADARRIGAELAQKHGFDEWELRQEIKSGEQLANRPVMLGILRDIESGKVGALIVQDFTRLSRDQDGIDGRVIRAVCRDNDCLIITPTKVFNFARDIDDDLSDVELLVGKIHKRALVRALVRGMREKARQGQLISGATPFGYRRVYDTPEPGRRPVGRLVVDEEEAEVVRLIYARYLDLGSAGKVARWLNENGYRKPVKSEKMRKKYGLGETRPFKRGDITRLIANPLYSGWAVWGRKCESRYLRDFEAQWHYRPELQIVSQDIWDRANALRERNAQTPARAVGSQYAFSLLLRCRHCGSSLVGTSAMRPAGRRKKYRCSVRLKSGPSACEGQTINETVVARGVLPLAAGLLRQGLRLEAALEEAAREKSRTTDETLEQNWRAELAEVERQADNLARAIARGIITDGQAKKTGRELAERKTELQRNLARLTERGAVRRELLAAIPEIVQSTEGLLWKLLEQEPAKLSRILRLMFAPRSVVVEAFGPMSRRGCRVLSYRLTEPFEQAIESSGTRSKPPWKPPAR